MVRGGKGWPASTVDRRSAPGSTASPRMHRSTRSAATLRRVLPVDLTADDAAGAETLRWIEPFAHTVGPESPEAAAVRRESVELAFVTALQILPANQRAVLLLRDVLAFSADDTAAILGASVASVTSSLQRARRTVERRLPDTTQREVIDRLGAQATDRIATRYVEAWERSDTQALVALLCADATFSMPPDSTWFAGRAAIADSSSTPSRCGTRGADPDRRRRSRRIRLLPIDDDTGNWTAHSLDVAHARPRWDRGDRRIPRPVARHPARVARRTSSAMSRSTRSHGTGPLYGKRTVSLPDR